MDAGAWQAILGYKAPSQLEYKGDSESKYIRIGGMNDLMVKIIDDHFYYTRREGWFVKVR